MVTTESNEAGMRSDALEIMQAAYRAADDAAKRGDLQRAEEQLAKAEVWRVRARSHGAKV